MISCVPNDILSNAACYQCYPEKQLDAVLTSLLCQWVNAAVEVSALNGLVAYWKLEEASGNRLDASGNNRSLSPINTPGSAAGKVGDAATFVAASSQYLRRASEPMLQAGSHSFTMAAWVNFNVASEAANRSVIGKRGPAPALLEYEITRLTSLKARFLITIQVTPSVITTQVDSAVTLPHSTWHFIVAWRDSSTNTINIQINDGAVASSSGATAIINDTSTFKIGYDNVAFMWGLIDEVGFWCRALTADERTYLYNTGTGRTMPFTP